MRMSETGPFLQLLGAPEPERRNFQTAVSQSALLHWSLLQGFTMTLIASRSFIAR